MKDGSHALCRGPVPIRFPFYLRRILGGNQVTRGNSFDEAGKILYIPQRDWSIRLIIVVTMLCNDGAEQIRRRGSYGGRDLNIKIRKRSQCFINAGGVKNLQFPQEDFLS